MRVLGVVSRGRRGGDRDGGVQFQLLEVLVWVRIGRRRNALTSQPLEVTWKLQQRSSLICFNCGINVGFVPLVARAFLPHIPLACSHNSS